MRADDTRPIWVQLADAFQARILSGEWEPGAKVPSVRELAIEMGVNPNTVQRSLASLDSRGLTLTERTAGRFVTTNADAINEARLGAASAAADVYIAAARDYGIDEDSAVALVAARWRASAGPGVPVGVR